MRYNPESKRKRQVSRKLFAECSQTVFDTFVPYQTFRIVALSPLRLHNSQAFLSIASRNFKIDDDAWSGNGSYCEDDGGNPPKHQTSRKLIAYTVAGNNGEPVLTQVMHHD